MLRRSRRVGGGLLLALLALLVPTLAAAQTSDNDAAAPSAPSVTLMSQPAWVKTDDVFIFRVRVSGEIPSADEYQVRVGVHPALTTRSAFEQTAQGLSLGSTLRTVTVDVPERRATRRSFRVALGLDDSPWPVSIPVGSTGVYPIEVQLVPRGGGAVVSSFVTWLVAIDADASPPIDEQLRVAWIISAVADPLARPDGGSNLDVLGEYASNGRLGRIAQLLDDVRSVPTSLALGPETVESWKSAAAADSSLQEGLEQIERAAGRSSVQLLPTTYVPIDIPALDAAGLGDQLAGALVAGADTLERVVGTRPDPRRAFVEPVSGAALARLRLAFTDSVAVREKALEPRDSSLTPARPFLIESGPPRFNGAATNDALADLLRGDAPPPLRAQRYLAALSLVALEQPALARGLVFSTTQQWTADLATDRLMFWGLRDHPLLQPTTLDEYFTQVPLETDDNGTVVRRLAPSEPGELPVTEEQWRSARRDLDTFETMVGARDPRVIRGERALRVSLSSTLTPARARAELETISRATDTFLSGISTAQKRVTLTARRAEIPLNFRNDTGQEVRVRVRLASPKLLFPDGDEKVLTLAEGNSTERFAVEARASGTFPMEVTILSEDGRIRIGPPTRVTVRSAVFSGWGVLLTVGALLFLAGWWANHLSRARKARRAAAAGATGAES